MMFDAEAAIKQIEAKDLLAKVLLNQEPEDDLKAKEIVSLLHNPTISMLKKIAEPLARVLGALSNPSILEAPQLELKPLLSPLRYVFLSDNNTLPVILSAARVDAVIVVLKRRKRDIGWQMSALHGISMALCMY